jgi:hypothetical protein
MAEAETIVLGIEAHLPGAKFFQIDDMLAPRSKAAANSVA